MDVYYQLKHRLMATTLTRKFDISHWFLCGADGRAYGHVITKTVSDGQIIKFS